MPQLVLSSSQSAATRGNLPSTSFQSLFPNENMSATMSSHMNTAPYTPLSENHHLVLHQTDIKANKHPLSAFSSLLQTSQTSTHHPKQLEPHLRQVTTSPFDRSVPNPVLAIFPIPASHIFTAFCTRTCIALLRFRGLVTLFVFTVVQSRAADNFVLWEYLDIWFVLPATM